MGVNFLQSAPRHQVHPKNKAVVWPILYICVLPNHNLQMSSSGGHDAKYFSRGKVQEFQEELKEIKKGDSSKSFKETKKILKKVIANITMGNDVSALANEMIGLLSIPEPEVKKMVYLFIVSYAALKPEIAEAAIPAFALVWARVMLLLTLQDTLDENPLIRVLAIRNMTNIPVEKVWLAACEPLKRVCLLYLNLTWRLFVLGSC